MAAAMLLVSGVGLLNAVKPAEATFPGTNGRIVYTGFVGPDFETEIYTMNPNGTDQTRLTNNTSYDDNPTWSPDGQRIAFYRDSDIYVMNADGTEQTNITNNPDYESDPDWSRDGTEIAYYRSEASGSIDDVWVRKVDGTGSPRRLTYNFDTQSGRGLAWSPDGKKFAVPSDQGGMTIPPLDSSW